MNVERAKELLPVIQAFSEGKQIERQICDGTWIIEFLPSWSSAVYRIKPEVKRMPFKFSDRDEFRGKWVCYKTSFGEFYINCIEEKGIRLSDREYLSYEEASYRLTFIDGTPFNRGVII